VLLDAVVNSDKWRVGFALANFGDTHVQIEDANLSLNLIQNLWITGGYYANWDDDYTYNKWFTQSSLTDYMSMGTPTARVGLFYEFTPDMIVEVGVMNSGFSPELEETNFGKAIYAKLDCGNFVEDWNLTASFLTSPEGVPTQTRSLSEAYLQVDGLVARRLDLQFQGKLWMLGVSKDDADDAENAFTAQVLARYHFNEKFAAGIRGGYTVADEWSEINYNGLDLGIVCEYNPTPFTYLRLEGGMLSLTPLEGDAAVFQHKDDVDGSRMSVALSMGFKFGLFEHIFGAEH
jgi:hypothetical protein